MVQLIGHGDVKLEEGQRVLDAFYQDWANARVNPEFKLSREAVMETIVGLLNFAEQLLEKCDGVWRIRNNTS